MNTKEILREIMEKHGVGVAVLGRRMNLSMIYVANRLSSKNMTTKVLNEFCAALGYRIVLMPVDKKVPKDCYVLEELKEEDEGK